MAEDEERKKYGRDMDRVEELPQISSKKRKHEIKCKLKLEMYAVCACGCTMYNVQCTVTEREYVSMYFIVHM